MVLGKLSFAPGPVLISVSALGFGVAFFLEGVAHAYGLWSTVGSQQLQLFNLFSTEMIVAIVLQALLLSMLYEIMFDNRRYSIAPARNRLVAFGLFALLMTVLIFAQQYFLPSTVNSSAYVYLIAAIVCASVASLLFLKAFRATLS